MERKSYMKRALEIADIKAKYDAEVKKILSDKNVLAWILKHTAKEFATMSIPEIVNSIEGEVTYDIRFYALTPTKEPIKLLVNVEGQKRYHPGYDLVTRAIFYCARMLSAQKEKHSIICFQP